MEFSNGGKIILEDSKATCPISGSPCISVIKHGQSMAGSSSSASESNQAVQQQINPMVDPHKLEDDPNIKEVMLT